jgi:hypothetical protein
MTLGQQIFGSALIIALPVLYVWVKLHWWDRYRQREKR